MDVSTLPPRTPTDPPPTPIADPTPPTGRQAVLSKAMRVVDEETRREVRDARLEALEADNYVENQDAGDEAYVDSEVGGWVVRGCSDVHCVSVPISMSNPSIHPTHKCRGRTRPRRAASARPRSGSARRPARGPSRGSRPAASCRASSSRAWRSGSSRRCVPPIDSHTCFPRPQTHHTTRHNNDRGTTPPTGPTT